jgi:hypothetical protein
MHGSTITVHDDDDDDSACLSVARLSWRQQITAAAKKHWAPLLV